MGLQYVLSIFGRTLSDRPLSSAWRMTGKPEIVSGPGVGLRGSSVSPDVVAAQISAKAIYRDQSESLLPLSQRSRGTGRSGIADRFRYAWLRASGLASHLSETEL